MERYIKHLIKGAEQRTEAFMRNQEQNPKDLQYGGIHGDVCEAKTTIYALATALSVYFHKDSRYYQNEELFSAMNLALDFIGRVQRDNGFFDYPSCNFQSAADTSFCFKRLIAGYRLVEKYGKEDTKFEEIKKKYLTIMHKAAEAVRNGGFHTPNHRWGISAALMQAANLFADEKEFAESLRARAAQYLAEGIDGDEDGEYAERSTGNYNAVVNNAMFALYQECKDEAYFGFADRNLRMMLYYIDPDDTIFTQNSTRQDQGKAEFADKYFYQYLYAACVTGEEIFDAAAHKIIKDNMERGDIAPDCFHIIMRHEEMLNHKFKSYGFLPSYRKYFRHSGVLRVKKENYTYTILSGKTSFLFFKTGSAMLYLKIGESCCNQRNFTPASVEVTDNGCILNGNFKSWYYLPFGAYQGTTDWWEMDNTKREKLIPDEILTNLRIEEKEDGLRITLKAEGLKGLPLRLETCIPANSVIQNEHFYMKAEAGSGMILRDGTLKIETAGKKLLIGDGFGEHEFKGHYSGEEANDTGFTVFCNAYTPLEKVFEIRVEK